MSEKYASWVLCFRGDSFRWRKMNIPLRDIPGSQEPYSINELEEYGQKTWGDHPDIRCGKGYIFYESVQRTLGPLGPR